MTFANFGLAFSAIALNAAAQLFLRSGMRGIEGGVASLGHFGSLLPKLMVTPSILSGFACYALSIGLWLAVLSRLPVGVAYPMQSLGYVIVAVAAYMLFGEAITLNKMLGIVVILVGVFLLSRT